MSRSSDPLRGIAPVLLALIGLAFGAGMIAEGYYDLAAWGPIGLGFVAVAIALVIGAPAVPRNRAAVALGSLAALFLWSLLSVGWSESGELAKVATARWALYVAIFAVLLLLLRNGRDRKVLLAACAAGVLAAALYVSFRMAGGEGADMFYGGRLRDPLGYINGQAGYFLVGFWLFAAVAERVRIPALAGAGMAGAFLIACLLLLSQSRAVLPGVAISALVVLAVVPGRGRRLWILLLIGAGVAAISGPLLDVYQDTPADPLALADSVAESAGRAMLAGAVVIGILWGVFAYVSGRPLERAIGDRAGVTQWLPRVAGAAAAVIVAIGFLGALATVEDPAGKVRDQYDEFRTLDVSGGSEQSSRFFSGGGYRYDYWKVAWNEFKDAPLKGQGSGNYPVQYFERRETPEDIRQPHSLELQTLAELGLVGALLLAAFVLATLWGLVRQSRRARDDLDERAIAVAGGGAFIAWLVHTSVDWLHIIPGVTGIALAAAAVLVSRHVQRMRADVTSQWRIIATLAAVAIALVAANAIARPTAANHLRVQSQEAVRDDPVEALRLANQALDVDRDSMRALYAKSAAYARLGRYGPARGALLEAAEREPKAHLPWALLGDLAARRGEIRQARRDYARASMLNPQDSRLRDLAKDPRLALNGTR